MVEITMRRAKSGDAAAIAAIIENTLSGPNPAGFDARLGSDEVERWIERLGEAGAIYLTGVDAETAGVGALDFDTQQPDTATLGIWLKSSHRRQGIGTRLPRSCWNTRGRTTSSASCGVGPTLTSPR